MSASSDLALAIHEEEKRVGEMDDQQRHNFSLLYSKDRLAPLDAIREKHMKDFAKFKDELRSRYGNETTNTQ